ncbi:MAG: hypothetical protein JF586_16840 [Burkholderiales bacterium]|jgi:hypothetical protein|nr:hypothetical protein [Burkholderiales bacterium]
MAFENVWEPAGVTTRFTGFVTAQEYVRSAEEICADARFDGLQFVIKDLLAIDDHAIEIEASDPIAAIRYGARFTNPNIYLVLLTTDERLLPFAHPRADSFLHGLYETHAFPSDEVARRWLAAQPPLARPDGRLGRSSA